MSEDFEMSLSKWQILFRNYEQAIWQSEKASLKTTTVVGTKDENADRDILRALAGEITMWRDREFQHYNEKRKRLGLKPGPDDSNALQLDSKAGSEIDKQLEELIGSAPETVITSKDTVDSPKQVDVSQIELYEINNDSRAHTSVYPLSFRCQRCGHYEIIDPRGHHNLVCPCCKQAWCSNCNKDTPFKEGNKCSICGHDVKRNELYQFSFVFACPRCANIEELTPRIVKLREVQGLRIPCQNANAQCKGHMHFMMFGSFQNAYWRCETCNYRDKVDKHCKCHISKSEDAGLRAIPSIMRPITTSAPSIMRPLIKSYLYMGTSTVTLNGLQKEHEKSKSIDSESWRLKEQVPEIDLQVMKEQYGIIDAFTVPKITTLTIVYGYISGIQTFPTRISEDERMAQLFRHGHKYHAYEVKTNGRGLVIVFDKDKVLETLKKHDIQFNSYQELVDASIAQMGTGQFQRVIENPNSAPLVAQLHGIEHVLMKTLMDQTGLEEFGSKIFLEDCCIVLYERENLGSGGLIQLTKSKQGLEFKKFLMKSEKHLRVCPQLCSRGCLACIFINDFYCQPYLPNEVARWFPPNSMLNRNFSRDFFNVK